MARAKAVAEEQASPYERDLCLWLEQQAALLRARRFDEVDLANLVEEIEAMARRDRKAVKHNLIVVLSHLLKHQYQPAERSSSWRGSILEHRRRLRDDFEESPSLRPHAAALFARAYADSREQASTESGLPLQVFPETSSYSLEQALDPGSLPE